MLFFFFFKDTAPTEIYTLSLHDALPIFSPVKVPVEPPVITATRSPAARTVRPSNAGALAPSARTDRKSTRLNSSHVEISYAVFCLKKKKKKNTTHHSTPLTSMLHTTLPH